DILENQEFSDIMASIGLAIGQEPEWDKLRYSKIVFLADSDVDGGHINTLLTNFFYSFWPQLFQEGCIQIAKAPLFEVITDKKNLYVESQDELDNLKKKKGIKIKEIQRNKGLGEMSPEAFKHVMNREMYTIIDVEDAKEAKHTLNICFGKDTSLRKSLLLDHEDYEGGSEKKAPVKKKKVAKKKVAKKKATKKKATKKKVTKKKAKKRK
ncbi:MAG: hypothetical protein ACO2ZP_07925, partial [Bacteriovoracaceae bacterium]